MARILLVEDDQRIRQLVADGLAGHGHDVISAAAAMDGLNELVASAPDLVVLDLGLPDLEGTELLKMMRAVSAVPVVVATARSEDSDVIAVLDAGADDYIVKPFSVAQLAARIRAVLRRSGDEQGTETIVIGALEIDAPAREVRLGGAVLDLSPKEFDLLRYLAEHRGEVVSKRDLLAEVWRQPYGGSDKTVDVHLSWLRRKLGESASDPRFLRTVFGVGVKLVEPES
ncbi:MAG: response regulator transcription factor [Acidimicrobiia bacterium]|nr:response regulator transcription factor [Acidimicrobiia bacterium]